MWSLWETEGGMWRLAPSTMSGLAAPQNPTYFDEPVKGEAASEGDIELFLALKGQEVTLDSLTDSNGAVLGQGGERTGH